LRSSCSFVAYLGERGDERLEEAQQGEVELRGAVAALQLSEHVEQPHVVLQRARVVVVPGVLAQRVEDRVVLFGQVPEDQREALQELEHLQAVARLRVVLPAAEVHEDAEQAVLQLLLLVHQLRHDQTDRAAEPQEEPRKVVLQHQDLEELQDLDPFLAALAVDLEEDAEVLGLLEELLEDADHEVLGLLADLR